MLAGFHQPDDAPELLEVDVLLRFQLVLLEEGDDDASQVLDAPDAVRHAVFTVPPYYPAAEKRLQGVQQLNVAFMLHYGELG